VSNVYYSICVIQKLIDNLTIKKYFKSTTDVVKEFVLLCKAKQISQQVIDDTVNLFRAQWLRDLTTFFEMQQRSIRKEFV